MADHNLSAPLLSSSHSSDDEAHFILTIPDDSPPQPSHQIQRSNGHHLSCNGSNSARLQFDEVNPFSFLGATGFEVPEPATVDPFKNNTPRIEGLYERLKIVVCLPIALLRLVLFGLCLMVGYVATVCALHGWKDKDNPMPKWRCRLMWVTRLCARWILFSFGLVLKRKSNLLILDLGSGWATYVRLSCSVKVHYLRGALVRVSLMTNEEQLVQERRSSDVIIEEDDKSLNFRN